MTIGSSDNIIKMIFQVMTRLQYLDFHTYLPEDILTKVDRVSMSVSLECRVPLLSKDLIEYVFSLSEDLKLHNKTLKGLMKETFKGILPQEIINREKKGFSIPFQSLNLLFKETQRKQIYILDKFMEDK